MGGFSVFGFMPNLAPQRSKSNFEQAHSEELAYYYAHPDCRIWGIDPGCLNHIAIR